MPRSPVVISAITALYLLNVVQVVSKWVWTDRFLVLSGQSSDAAYLFANTGPSWIYLITNINAFLLATIADSLLIWRCYYIWSRSVRIIMVPLALLLTEIGAGIANIARISIDHLNPVIYESGAGLQIQTSIAIFSAFALTLIATSLILYRIIATTRQTSVLKRTQNTYREIVDLVVQSSAVYSVVLLVWAISWVISPPSTATKICVSSLLYVRLWGTFVLFGQGWE
ncbi:hypothetical protein HYPSUDRAFT_201099 [Hypholoma sublateritium FD-334 SS-4]|uniref:Uncharacterized protein n=1 Tax=Hypholoma sublateritium (strain FD-334 SS-4) TaxID=945553 RepID=A0A0D2MJ13_HYPSF|nr:hypothetical protein HYPSUDRAFT_201099 [Hypholoma sublateritium FD-334 SS-4]